MTEPLILDSVHNFRDVAGPGYPVPGGRMRRGVVLRSSALEPSEDDVDRLEAAGLARVVDLRTADEVARQPDLLPPGVEAVEVDVLAGRESAAVFDGSVTFTAEQARQEMLDTYRAFVEEEPVRRAFGRAVRAVATVDGPVVVHCTAGKDRTGWLSAVLQLVAGVEREQVLADYLLTTELSADFVSGIRAMIREAMPENEEAVAVLLGVERGYLESALDVMGRRYGDVRGYLVEGAGLEDEVVDGLRGRLVRSAEN